MFVYLMGTKRLSLLPLEQNSSSRRSSESLCHGKKDEIVGATTIVDTRKGHAIGVPPDARKSNIFFLTGVLAVAKQRHEVHRVSATLTHEVIDDFFLSRRPDLSLPFFSLSSSTLSATFAAH